LAPRRVWAKSNTLPAQRVISIACPTASSEGTQTIDASKRRDPPPGPLPTACGEGGDSGGEESVPLFASFPSFPSVTSLPFCGPSPPLISVSIRVHPWLLPFFVYFVVNPSSSSALIVHLAPNCRAIPSRVGSRSLAATFAPTSVSRRVNRRPTGPCP